MSERLRLSPSGPYVEVLINDEPAGGDLSGTLPDPAVVALTESGGTSLSIAAVPDGSFLLRVGNSVLGGTAAPTPTIALAAGPINLTAPGVALATLVGSPAVGQHLLFAECDLTLNGAGTITAQLRDGGGNPIGSPATVQGAAGDVVHLSLGPVSVSGLVENYDLFAADSGAAATAANVRVTALSWGP